MHERRGDGTCTHDDGAFVRPPFVTLPSFPFTMLEAAPCIMFTRSDRADSAPKAMSAISFSDFTPRCVAWG